MRQRLDALIGGSEARTDTILSIGAGFVSQAALLVTGIIVARALGVENRGHFAFIFLISQVMATLGSLGVPLAVTYYVAEDPGRARPMALRLRRFVAIQFCAVTAVHAVLLIALFWSTRSEIQIAAAISLVTSGMQVVQQYALGLIQGLRRFVWFNVLRVAAPGGYALIAGAFWVLGYRTLLNMTIAYTATYVVAGVATIIVAGRLLAGCPHFVRDGGPDARRMIRFGLRGLLGAASPLETFKIDQSLVGLFLSAASLGLYVSAVAFTNLPRFIAQSIGMVAYPYIARHSNEHSRRLTMWRFVAIAALICGVAVALLEIAVPILMPLLFGSAFKAATPVARVLLIASFLTSMRRIMSDGARGIGRPGAGSVAEFASLLLLVPCLLICVQLGLVAIAWGLTGCACVSVCILLMLLLKRRSAVSPPSVVHVAGAEGRVVDVGGTG